MQNALASEIAAVVATIDPDVTTASTVTSDWVDMGLFDQIMAVVMAGTLGTSATLNAKIEQATSSAGAGAKDLTGKLITELTQAGTDSDKQAIINVRAEELDIDNGFSFARLSMTVGVATSDAGAIVLGFGPRYGPASDNDLSTVDEIVA
jgi:hypothetical protein